MEATNKNQPLPGFAALELGIGADVPQIKTCRICGRTLPISQFHRSWKSKDGHQHICKECNHDTAMANLEKAHATLLNRPRAGERNPRPGVKRTLTLADFTDDQLAAEFSRRGYTGNITKTSTLSI